MLRPIWLAAAFAATFAPAAFADTITLADDKGAPVEIDTATLQGCRIVFDSAGAPFEICRMKKVELTPPASTRARPGEADKAARAGEVVYVKAAE